jgi:Uma2 family endonuclease
MSTTENRHYTVEEYLEFERASEFKHEYYQGEIFAMGGASYAHGQLISNVISLLGAHFKGGPCQALPSDLRVKVDRTGLYTYPDIVVVCGDPVFEDDVFDTLLNPKVIFEVLSDSTEAYDRGDKFAQYRTIKSLEQYVLVSQRDYHIAVFTKRDGNWGFTEALGLNARIEICAVACLMDLGNVYERVRPHCEPEKPNV